MKSEFPSIREKNDSIPQSVENIILRATAKNPKNRYETVSRMHDDLLTCLNEDRLNEGKVTFLFPEHESDSEDKKPVLLEEKEEEIKELEDELGDLREEKKNTWIWILSGAFIFVALLLVGILVIYPIFSEVPDIVIPNVAGMTVQKAEDTLKKAGFEVELKVEQVSDEKIEAGLISKTSPAIGRKVKKGTNITLFESLGDTVYEMEDFKGKNYKEIKAILESKYELEVIIEKIDPEDDTEYGEEEIIRTDPEKGTKVSKGQKITIYVPNVVDEYPNFKEEEWTIDEIQAFCDKYGVIVSFVAKPTNDLQPNTIIEQSRAAGSPIVKGANLKIIYAVKYEEETKKEETKTDTNDTKTEEKKDDNN